MNLQTFSALFLKNFLKTFYTTTHVCPSAESRKELNSNTGNICAKLQAFQQKSRIQSVRKENPGHNPCNAQNKACNQLERKRMSNIPQTCESRLKHPKIGKLKALKFLVNSCRFSPLWHGTCINWNEPAMQKRIGVSHDNPIPNPTNYEQNLFFFYSFILLSSYSSRTDLINSRTILLAGFSLNFLIVSKDVVPK